ncbi:MAG: winged helix-turn-helix transcriptional regulator [Alphaproteobacteria bacterium]|nr:winged helix-turn-helix transcriptional regulator [Alphaproteobacteria bacterium]
MKQSQAIAALSGLAQETRLDIFRLLVKAGDGGLASGALAEKLKISAASASFHLGQLENAGLISSGRVSRSIIYKAKFEAVGAMINFLLEDCCAGDRRVKACC